MLININQIKINDRIRRDFGNIPELADDIKQNGLINPPAVTSGSDDTYILLAGERRIQAMKLLGYTQTEVTVMNITDAEHQLNIEISENETRKDFTKAERMKYAKRLERIEAAKARERMLAGKADPKENFPEGIQTRDIVASKLGIGSGKQYEKEKFIVDNQELLSPEEFAEWDESKLSTNKAYQKIKSELNAQKSQNEQLKKKLEEAQNAPTVIREIDKTDYTKIAELEKQVQNAQAECENAYRDFRNKVKEAQDLRDKVSELEAAKIENKEAKYIQESCFIFNARVRSFIKETGGYIWLAEEINKMPDVEQEGYLRSIEMIEEWVNAIKYNIKKTEPIIDESKYENDKQESSVINKEKVIHTAYKELCQA